MRILKKAFWCAVFAVCILVVTITYKNHALIFNQKEPYKFIIKDKEIMIPAEYRAVNYGTGQFHSSIYFRADVDSFKPTYADPAKNKSVVSILLVDDFASENEAQKYIENLLVGQGNLKPPTCKSVEGPDRERLLCEYPTDSKTHNKAFVLKNKTSGQNITVISCDIGGAKRLPNPLCDANAVIFNDVRLHYSFSASNIKNAPKIDEGVREIFKKHTQKIEGK